MRAKLIDVARHAGVSLTTASFALRDSSRVSATTRQRVLRSAQELSYQPDTTAQTLARSSVRRDSFHGTMGLVLHPAEKIRVERRMRGKTFFEMLPESAESLGYKLDIFELPLDRRGTAALAHTLLSRGIHGLIMMTENTVLTELGFPWEHFATILIGTNSGDKRFHRINTHSFNDGYEAVLACHARGYRRFGLAIHTKEFPDWLGGFHAAVHRLGVAKDASVFDSVDWDEPGFVAWFKSKQPDLIIANHGARPADTLQRLGVGIPHEVGLFALDLNEVRADIAGWNQMRSRCNQLAVETLHVLLRRAEFGMPPAATLIDIASIWVEGKTLRPPPA